VSAVISPFMGIFVDRYGYRMIIIVMGAVLMILAHFLYLVMPDCHQCTLSVVPLVLLGISYTTYAIVLFGALPYIVDEKLLGSAFGLCGSFQNIGTFIAPIIITWITGESDNPNKIHNYNWILCFFIAISAIALLLNLLIYFIYKKE